MVSPYHCLHVSDNFLVAARGGTIETFRLDDSSHAGLWSHPNVKASRDSATAAQEAQTATSLVPEPKDTVSDSPPAKRRRVEDEIANQDESTQGIEKGQGTAQAKPDGKAFAQQRGKVPDVTVIIALEVSPDGKHIVAVTGNDKTIWVIKRDDSGALNQLSRRTMPKRPCSIAITHDGQTIISADKFGDVYSLPLLPSEVPVAQPVRPTPAAPSKKEFMPQATELTVHSMRNLRALEHQRLAAQKNQEQRYHKTECNFEHTLLLGHVSVLTAVALASLGSKRYIITADRDEHIRISRGIPQAHVIESYCLGHEEFVSKLCLPTTRPEVLISGGGDKDLLLWDWRASKLIRRVPLLEHAQKIVSDTTKIAVSGIHVFANQESGGIDMLVTCEKLSAVFIFRLPNDSQNLHHFATISLPAHPLDAAVIRKRGADSAILVSLLTKDPVQAIVKLEPEQGTWRISQATLQHQSVGSDNGGDLSLEEIESLVFTAENLRKMEQEGAGGDIEQ